MLEENGDLPFVIKAVVEELGDSVASSVRRACTGIVLSEQVESVTVSNVFKEIISSEKYWKIQNSILLDHDLLLNRPRRGSSYVTLSREQIEDLCESLYHAGLRYRLKAMEYLIRCVSTESFLALSCWERLESGLRLNLNHPVCVISEASLQVYKKFLVSSTPELSLESYVGLLKFLSSVLHKDSSIFNVFHNQFVTDVVQLLNKFQRNIPKHWLRYPANVITQIIVNTLEFYDECRWSMKNDVVGLGHYLWLVDPKGLWVNNFLCSLISRQALYTSLSNCQHLLSSLVESCQLFLDNRLPSNSYVIESIAILLRLFRFGDKFTSLENIAFGNVDINTILELESLRLSHTGETDSIWHLLVSVYRKLIKLENVFWMAEIFSHIIQKQMEEHSVIKLLLLILGDSPFDDNVDYLIFHSDCISALSKSSQCRHLLLRNTNYFEHILKYSSRNFLSLEELPNLPAEIVLCNCFTIIQHLLQEPSSFLLLPKFYYEELLRNLSEIHFPAQLERNNSVQYHAMETLIRFSQNELGMYFLNQCSQCLESVLNSPIEVLAKRENMARFCLQIFSLSISTPLLELNKAIFRKCELTSLAKTTCVDCNCLSWKLCFESQQKLIPHYTTQVLQYFNVPDVDFTLQICNLLFKAESHLTGCEKCYEILNFNTLNYLLCDLNILFYFQLNGDIMQMLIEQKEFEVSENGSISHESSSIRNHILVRLSVFGGCKERCLPEKNVFVDNVSSADTVLPRFSEYVLSNEDGLLQQYESLEPVEYLDLQCFFMDSITKNNISLNISMLVVRTLTENSNNTDFETVNEQFDCLERSIDFYGIKATVEYGLQQKLLLDPDDDSHCTNLWVLLNYLGQNGLLNDSAFNFLAATIFIISRGDMQTSAHFLKILNTERNGLSITKLFNSIQDTKPNFVRSVLCTFFSVIVQEQLPLVFNAFSMAEFLPHQCLTLWLGQCFWNVLNLDQIACIIILSYFGSPFHLLYICIALLRQMETDLFCQIEKNNLHCFVREYSASDFEIVDQLDFISRLDEKYSLIIKDKLDNYLS